MFMTVALSRSLSKPAVFSKKIVVDASYVYDLLHVNVIINCSIASEKSIMYNNGIFVR
jgi:hypothetical protein